MKDKKIYTTPSCMVEEFQPNEYVCTCSVAKMIGTAQCYPSDKFYLDMNNNGILDSYEGGKNWQSSNNVNTDDKFTGVYYFGWFYYAQQKESEEAESKGYYSSQPDYFIAQVTQGSNTHYVAYSRSDVDVNRS